MKRKLSMGLILVTVMLLALAASPVFGGNGEDGPQKAKEVQERHTARLLGLKAPPWVTRPTVEVQYS